MSSLLEPGSQRAAHLVDDRALVAAMLRVEVAWLRVLTAAGAGPGEEAVQAVARAAARVDPHLPPAAVEAAGSPVLPLVHALHAAIDDDTVAALVHCGLTSQDVLDSALVLMAKDALTQIQNDLSRTGDALAHLAAGHRTSVATGRTLTQHAVPVTAGLRFAQWLLGVLDAREAVQDVRAALPVQCGGAAGTLSRAGDLVGDPRELVHALATELGLQAGLPWHTRRAPMLRVGNTLGEVCAALGVIAGNVLLLGRPEIAELSEGRAPGRGASSTMPHKRNPVLSVLIRSAALQAPQLVAQLHLCAGQVVDERPPGEWHAEWPALRRLLEVTLTACSQAAELVEGLHVDVPGARARALQAADALLAERGGEGDIGSHLGMSGSFVDQAVRSWQASRA